MVRYIVTVGTAVILSFVAAISNAAEAEEQEKLVKKGWNTEIHAGLNLTRGNSKNLLINASLLEEYNKGDNRFRLNIQGSYGESETGKSGTNDIKQTTVQNVQGVAEYKRLFSERDYGYANASIINNRIAGIDYRAIAGPGVGRYFLKSDRINLNVEIGAAYVHQCLLKDIRNSVNLRVAHRFEMKLLDTSKLWESIEYIPVINDPGNYLVNFEIGVETAITTLLNLRLVLQDQFNSQPASGKERNDLQLTAGIGCQL